LISPCKIYAGIIRYYVESQTEHHCKKSFKEELIEFLTEHGVEYDEKYL
jgi:hypothetical protein